LFDATPDESGSSRTFIATAALAVGLLTGFAGGYVTGQRKHAPSSPGPGVTVQERRPAERPSEEPAHAYTETPLPQPTAVVATAEVTSPGGPGVLTAAPRADVPRVSASTRTGILAVFSRPSGAQVFVDERLVGTTPLSLDDVAAGPHGVRIALPDYQRWATSVTVTGGSSVRVAASLER
jgi:hypothetical protein